MCNCGCQVQALWGLTLQSLPSRTSLVRVCGKPLSVVSACWLSANCSEQEAPQARSLRSSPRKGSVSAPPASWKSTLPGPYTPQAGGPCSPAKTLASPELCVGLPLPAGHYFRNIHCRPSLVSSLKAGTDFHHFRGSLGNCHLNKLSLPRKRYMQL